MVIPGTLSLPITHTSYPSAFGIPDGLDLPGIRIWNAQYA